MSMLSLWVRGIFSYWFQGVFRRVLPVITVDAIGSGRVVRRIFVRFRQLSPRFSDFFSRLVVEKHLILLLYQVTLRFFYVE